MLRRCLKWDIHYMIYHDILYVLQYIYLYIYILYHIILYYIILYCIILYYIVYNIVLYNRWTPFHKAVVPLGIDRGTAFIATRSCTACRNVWCRVVETLETWDFNGILMGINGILMGFYSEIPMKWDLNSPKLDFIGDFIGDFNGIWWDLMNFDLVDLMVNDEWIDIHPKLEEWSFFLPTIRDPSGKYLTDSIRWWKYVGKNIFWNHYQERTGRYFWGPRSKLWSVWMTMLESSNMMFPWLFLL